MNARESGNKCPPVVGATEGRCIAFGANAGAGIAPKHEGIKASREAVIYFIGAARRWGYGGKRGRVMAMLATSPGGVTQWDCLPWHTRLGGTIHALRRDGLDIETEREGEYRHARYRLRTAGRLVTGDRP